MFIRGTYPGAQSERPRSLPSLGFARARVPAAPVAAGTRRTYADAVSEKDLLHSLVDCLPEAEVHSALRYLEFLLERGGALGRTLHAAPLDDEALDPDDLASADEALRDAESGASLDHREVRRRLLES